MKLSVHFTRLFHQVHKYSVLEKKNFKPPPILRSLSQLFDLADYK